ncbi:hypothetical protein IWZ01DRAFT_492415 [Phyllosticta capitalensis]
MDRSSEQEWSKAPSARVPHHDQIEDSSTPALSFGVSPSFYPSSSNDFMSETVDVYMSDFWDNSLQFESPSSPELQKLGQPDHTFQNGGLGDISTFGRNKNLRGHDWKNGTMKPYDCDWPGCGRAFRRKDNLERHKRIHNYGTAISETRPLLSAEAVNVSQCMTWQDLDQRDSGHGGSVPGANAEDVQMDDFDADNRDGELVREDSLNRNPGSLPNLRAPEMASNSVDPVEPTIHLEDIEFPSQDLSSYYDTLGLTHKPQPVFQSHHSYPTSSYLGQRVLQLEPEENGQNTAELPPELERMLKEGDLEGAGEYLQTFSLRNSAPNFSWIQELLEMDYSTKEVVELLQEQSLDSPWIFFEPQESNDLRVMEDCHIAGCCHKRLDTQDIGSLAENEDHSILLISRDRQDQVKSLVEGLCGLGGVAPSSRILEEWTGVVEFDKKNRGASVSYSTNFGAYSSGPFERQKAMLDVLVSVAKVLENIYHAAGILQDQQLCCESFSILVRSDTEHHAKLIRIPFSRVVELRAALLGDWIQQRSSGHRAASICDYCRSLSLKCDGKVPCTRCKVLHRPCENGGQGKPGKDPVDYPADDSKDSQNRAQTEAESWKMEDYGMYHSTTRHRKSNRPDDVKNICDECHKTFDRPRDLSKHKKTHARPWKCPEAKCKYHITGWPTEEERDCHVNNKHSATPAQFQCPFHPCTYSSKRESNWKQHMEKAHGWTYIHPGHKGNGNGVLPKRNPSKAKANSDDWVRVDFEKMLFESITRVGNFAHRLLRDLELATEISLNRSPASEIESAYLGATCLATQVISIGLMSYVQAHISPLRPSFLDTDIGTISLLGAEALESFPGIVVRPFRMTCMDDMLQRSVLVFQRNDAKNSAFFEEAFFEDEKATRLNLFAAPEDILDTWGPGCYMTTCSGMDELSRPVISGIRIGGGTIMASKERSDLYHFYPTTAFCMDGAPEQTMEQSKRILIGAIGAPLLVNDFCSNDENLRYLQCDPYLANLGTHPLFWEASQRQLALQGGQYMVAQFAQTWNKTSSATIKKCQLSQQSPLTMSFLESFWGLQVSFCTGIAKRVRMRELLADIVGIHVQNQLRVPPEWIELEHENVVDVLRNEPDLQAWLGQRSEEQQTFLERVIVQILERLGPTGIDCTGNLTIAWIRPNKEPRCLRIPCERESAWAKILADSVDCATYAYFTSKCLETERIRCQGRNSHWQRQSSLLATAVSPHQDFAGAATVQSTFQLEDRRFYYLGDSNLVRAQAIGLNETRLLFYRTSIGTPIWRRLMQKERHCRIRERQDNDSPARQVLVLTAER